MPATLVWFLSSRPLLKKGLLRNNTRKNIMNNKNNLSLNGLYKLNPEIDTNQIAEAVSDHLCKAEALALIASSADLDTYPPEIISNYLWALSDIIREAGWLYEKIIAINYKNTN